jgi:VWFA-related protein
MYMRRFTVSLLSLLAVSAFAQQPKVSEKVDVNLVLIDATVTDGRGHQILGLDKSDFVVSENGKPVSVDSVDYFTNRQLLDAPENKAAFKVDRVRDDRYFVFFFDKPEDNVLFDRVAQARFAVADFIKNRLKPGDMAAVAGHDVRLKVYSDFTDNKKQLQAALDQAATHTLGLAGAVGTPDLPSIMRNIDIKRMRNHTGTVYEALETLGDALKPIRARKELVLFTAGIVANDEEVRGSIILNQSRYYQPMIEALNGANVTVYPTNLTLDAPVVAHQTLTRLANESGGEYFRLNVGFETPLKKVEGTTSGYYLIAYYSPHPPGEHGFQKVNVALRNPEFNVKSREGYAFGE